MIESPLWPIIPNVCRLTDLPNRALSEERRGFRLDHHDRPESVRIELVIQQLTLFRSDTLRTTVFQPMGNVRS